MDPITASRAAEVLWVSWRSGERLPALPTELRPENLDGGYAVQRALDALVGDSAGWKIAATSSVGRAQLGVGGPLLGRLYRRFQHQTTAYLPVTGMQMRCAEPEFGFVMGRTLSAHPVSRADVVSAIDRMLLMIEVPDSRFADYSAAGGPQLVADAACSGHFVLGPTIEHWDDLDLPTQQVLMLRNGNEVSTWSGANVLGDPLEALTWMVNELSVRGWSLRPGRSS